MTEPKPPSLLVGPSGWMCPENDPSAPPKTGPPKLTDAEKSEARRRRAQGIPLAELARSYGVGISTIAA
jgi:hypothetical protein